MELRERNPPESSLYNILDFLTFFYNGTTDAATHNFIQSRILSVGAADSTLGCRYKDFYTLSAYLVVNQDWDAGSLEDLLADFVDLETKYKQTLKNKNLLMSRAWQSIKMKIVYQIAIATLRELLGLTGDTVGNFEVPDGFPFDSYEQEIKHIFRTHQRHYLEEDDASELKEEYYASIDNLTGEMFSTVPVKKSTRGRAASAAARTKKVFDESMLYQILEDHSTAKLIQNVYKFVRSVEEKVLPIPLDVGQYPPLDGGIHALLRGLTTSSSASKPTAPTAPTAPAAITSASKSAAPSAVLSASKPLPAAPLSTIKSASKIPVAPGSSLAAAVGASATKPTVAVAVNGSAAKIASPKLTAQKPTEVEHGAHRGPVPLEADWGDDQADTEGPYSFAELPVVDRGHRHKKKPASNVPKSPEMPADSPVGAVARASAARKPPAAAAPAAAARSTRAAAQAAVHDSDGALAVASDRLKRKYAETDPLNDFLGGDEVEERPAVKARVSRESLLSGSSSSRPAALPAAAAKPQTRVQKNPSAAFQASARGGKIDFGTSDSDTSDSDDIEEVSEDDSEGGATGKSAMQALLSLKQNGPGKASSFPARLQSPTGARRASLASGVSSSGKAKKAKKTDQVRVRWSFEEEQALEIGVQRYGEGNWLPMLQDAELSQVFRDRTNVNLKDKWRNMLKYK